MAHSATRILSEFHRNPVDYTEFAGYTLKTHGLPSYSNQVRFLNYPERKEFTFTLIEKATSKAFTFDVVVNYVHNSMVRITAYVNNGHLFSIPFYVQQERNGYDDLKITVGTVFDSVVNYYEGYCSVDEYNDFTALIDAVTRCTADVLGVATSRTASN